MSSWTGMLIGLVELVDIRQLLPDMECRRPRLALLLRLQGVLLGAFGFVSGIRRVTFDDLHTHLTLSSLHCSSVGDDVTS